MRFITPSISEDCKKMFSTGYSLNKVWTYYDTITHLLSVILSLLFLVTVPLGQMEGC